MQLIKITVLVNQIEYMFSIHANAFHLIIIKIANAIRSITQQNFILIQIISVKFALEIAFATVQGVVHVIKIHIEIIKLANVFLLCFNLMVAVQLVQSPIFFNKILVGVEIRIMFLHMIQNVMFVQTDARVVLKTEFFIVLLIRTELLYLFHQIQIN